MIDVKKLINNLQNELESTKKDLKQTEALERLKQVTKLYNGEDKVISFKEIYDRIKSNPVVEKIWTGWVELDKILNGIRKKHLIIWAGQTKHGKSTFAMDLTCHLKDYNVLWLPIEESGEELMEKFIERGEEPPIGFAPENIGFVDTDWVEKKILEGIVKYDSQIVIVDNLSWVRSVEGNKFNGKADNIEQTCMELKAIAKKWDIPIVLIAHTNKEAKADMNPTFENLKGSSAISQIGDKTIFIWRETKRGKNGELEITDNVNISVQLNRQCKVGNVKMVYRAGHFYEEEWTGEANETLRNYEKF